MRVSAPEQIFPTLADKLQAIVKRIVTLHATGRPILVGTRTVQASEDLAALLRAEGLAPQVLNATRIQEEAIIISLAGQPGQITIATNMAGRGTDIKLGAGVAAAGGLCVIAVERHESGRVDRQLIGRCARQGDPGASESFASMEDELIRKYSPTPLRKLMHRIPSLSRKNLRPRAAPSPTPSLSATHPSSRSRHMDGTVTEFCGKGIMQKSAPCRSRERSQRM